MAVLASFGSDIYNRYWKKDGEFDDFIFPSNYGGTGYQVEDSLTVTTEKTFPSGTVALFAEIPENGRIFEFKFIVSLVICELNSIPSLIFESKCISLKVSGVSSVVADTSSVAEETLEAASYAVI